jgi:predicted nucleic acid-binding protein
VIFWDASALVRCFTTAEPGHARVRQWLFSSEEHHGSALLRPEVTSAIVRRLGKDRRGTEKTLGWLEDSLAGMSLLPVGEGPLQGSVGLIRKHSLTAADAIHLATAVLHGRELGRRGFRFATCDARQAEAARAEGLRVLLP